MPTLPVTFTPKTPLYSGGTEIIGTCIINLGASVSIPLRWRVEIPQIGFSQEYDWKDRPCSEPNTLYAVIPLTEKISNATVKVTVIAPEGGPYTDWTTTYTTDILPGYDPTQTLLDLSVVNVEATVNPSTRTGTFKMTVKAVSKANVFLGFAVNNIPLSGLYYSFWYAYSRRGTNYFEGATSILNVVTLAPGENYIDIDGALLDVLGIGEDWNYPTPHAPQPGTRIPQGGTFTVTLTTYGYGGGEEVQKVSIPVEYEFLVVGGGTLECHAYLDSIEVSASVKVVGVGTYTTPFTVTLNAGDYTLNATYNTQTQTQTAHIVEGETTRVDFKFVAPTHTLTIIARAGGTTNPSPGTYTITEGKQQQVTAIPSANYKFAYWLLDGVTRTENPITVTMDKDHTLEAVFEYVPPPPLTATISGVVKDPAGNPIAGATVTCDGYADVTETDGTYIIADIPAKRYTLTVTKEGYQTKTIPVDLSAGGTFKIDVTLTPTAPPPPPPTPKVVGPLGFWKFPLLTQLAERVPIIQRLLNIIQQRTK